MLFRLLGSPLKGRSPPLPLYGYSQSLNSTLDTHEQKYTLVSTCTGPAPLPPPQKEGKCWLHVTRTGAFPRQPPKATQSIYCQNADSGKPHPFGGCKGHRERTGSHRRSPAWWLDILTEVTRNTKGIPLLFLSKWESPEAGARSPDYGRSRREGRKAWGRGRGLGEGVMPGPLAPQALAGRRKGRPSSGRGAGSNDKTETAAVWEGAPFLLSLEEAGGGCRSQWL